MSKVFRNGSSAITTQNLNPNSGVATAASSAVLDMSNEAADTATVQVVGTYTGALTPQVSNDGQNWVTLGGVPMINVNTGVGSANVPSATQGMYQLDTAGFAYFRMSALAAVTGQANVFIIGTDANGVVGLDTPLPAGTNSIGTVVAQQAATANPGTTPFTLNSAATTNATLLKASAGQLCNLEANNTTAADKFVRLYNKATAPVPGTDVPVMVVTVKANSSKEIEYGSTGKRFATGIGYAITAAATVLDATVVAAGDVQLAGDYV